MIAGPVCQLCAEVRCDWDCPNPGGRPQEEPDWNRLEPVWEFLTSPWRFDLPAATKDQRARVGRLQRELRSQLTASTPAAEVWQELNRRAANWPMLFPGATLTPEALAKHWRALGQPPLARTKAETETARARAALKAIDGGRR